MSNQENNYYSPCQIKFAFDVSNESPIAHYEYFGWEDVYDMIKPFFKNNLNSDTLYFVGTDFSGAKLTIIFETTCDPEFFQKYYELALTMLNKLTLNPEYNPCSNLFNSMLEELEENEITIYENEPDINVFLAYNKLHFGFETYQEFLKKIKNKTCF